MRFKTTSGTEYVFRNIARVDDHVAGCRFIGRLTRISDQPVLSVTGQTHDNRPDPVLVGFDYMPIVGLPFYFWNPEWHTDQPQRRTMSTPVKEIILDRTETVL